MSYSINSSEVNCSNSLALALGWKPPLTKWFERISPGIGSQKCQGIANSTIQSIIHLLSIPLPTLFYGLNAKPDSLPFIPCIWLNWHLIISSIKPSFPLSIIGIFNLVTLALVPHPMQLLVQASLLESQSWLDNLSPSCCIHQIPVFTKRISLWKSRASIYI